MLTDLKNRIDDTTIAKKSKDAEHAKAKGIEKSGELIRRMAIEGLDGEDSESDCSPPESEGSDVKPLANNPSGVVSPW